MDCAYFCLSILLTISSVITCLTNLERYSEDMFTDFKDISNMMLYYLCVTFVYFFPGTFSISNRRSNINGYSQKESQGKLNLPKGMGRESPAEQKSFIAYWLY